MSGFDRGHLAAAANHRMNQDLCDETFLLSNMAPQVRKDHIFGQKTMKLIFSS